MSADRDATGPGGGPATVSQDRAEDVQRLVLVTGPSGAGRSTAIHVLEDLGYEAIDNLPLSLIPRLLDGPPRPVPLALGVDARNRDFSVANLTDLIDWLTRDPAYAPEILYLDCAPERLARRYSETRRRHPLAPDVIPQQGIEAERAMLDPIRGRADVLVDTTDMTPHDLKADLTRWYDRDPDRRLTLSVHSFSYKRGVPRGLDTMFDVRFLANPHWQAELRAQDGRDPAVQAFVAADPRFAPFFGQVHDLLRTVLPAHVAEGRAHLAIGFGCTGGKHRSVTLAEKLAGALAAEGWPVSIRHRELEHRGQSDPAPMDAMPTDTGRTRDGGPAGADVNTGSDR